MKGLLERLHDRHWQITPQRRVIAKVLSGEHVHLTADEVHERAVAQMPEISRATIYKTLKELAELGEVREVTIGGRAKRYDPNVDARHHHLMCTSCGLIRDVSSQGELGFGLSIDQGYGFTVTDVDVTFRGLCPACVTAREHKSRRKLNLIPR